MEQLGTFRTMVFALVMGLSSGAVRVVGCDNPELEKRIEALEKLHAERD